MFLDSLLLFQLQLRFSKFQHSFCQPIFLLAITTLAFSLDFQFLGSLSIFKQDQLLQLIDGLLLLLVSSWPFDTQHLASFSFHSKTFRQPFRTFSISLLPLDSIMLLSLIARLLLLLSSFLLLLVNSLLVLTFSQCFATFSLTTSISKLQQSSSCHTASSIKTKFLRKCNFFGFPSRVVDQMEEREPQLQHKHLQTNML